MLQPHTILKNLLDSYPALCPLQTDLEAAFHMLCQNFAAGGLLLCCGNGGSSADADHIVGELMKSFRLPRPLPAALAEKFKAAPEFLSVLQGAMPAISLNSQSALISAYANDVQPDYIYAQQVLGYSAGRPALLLALSTSGNSANVVNAVKAANCLGLPSIGITGTAGGSLAELCTQCLKLPARETYQVQEYTLPVYHALCAMLEAQFFGEGENTL